MTLFWLSLVWMAGIAISLPADLTSPQWASLVGLSLTASLLFRKRKLQRWTFVIFFHNMPGCVARTRHQASD
ncbi:MAG: hypothetical protein WBZ24_03820 [Anaerolineales bacterium]|jgi:hypothetical protein